MILLITAIGLSIYLSISMDTFETEHTIPCKKWQGNIYTSPKNICKDCGYPIDCHGPYKGDSWRHIFRETPLF
jgi:ribosomal protein L37E